MKKTSEKIAIPYKHFLNKDKSSGNQTICADSDPVNGGSLLSPVNAVNLNNITDLWAQITENATNCTGIIDITTTINP